MLPPFPQHISRQQRETSAVLALRDLPPGLGDSFPNQVKPGKVDRYFLEPDGISWDHAVQVIQVQLNYVIQFIKFLGYRPVHAVLATEPTEQEIVQYTLNSTLLMLMDVEKKAEHLVVKLQLDDMRSPFFENGKATKMVAEFHVPRDDYSLERSKVTTFSYDGIDITKRSEQLLVLSTVVTTYIHPQMHSFSNGMHHRYCQLSRQERDQWSHLFLHGQYLNSVAHTYLSGCMGITQRAFAKILTDNGKKDLKNHGATTWILLPYSRFARFVLGMRQAIRRLVREHQVPVNPEDHFITSVLRSIDHLTCGRALLYRNLDTERLRPHAHPHLLTFMWYLPSENVYTNLLKDNVQANRFYRDLYAAATRIDPDFADHVSLSICY